MKISYAILTHNGEKDLSGLVAYLHKHKSSDDEIVILVDANEGEYAGENIKPVFESYSDIKWGFRPLNKDFAAQKNALADMCTGDYIFNIDSDELPSDELIASIHGILEANPSVDMFWVPRVNIVTGITQEHIAKWGWKVNDRGWINWPDYQNRIYKNSKDIRWVRPVHEVLSGHKTFSVLPDTDETYALYHIKDIERQEKQNNFYTQI